MSEHTSRTSAEQQQHLMRPSSFDGIDELEANGNGHTRNHKPRSYSRGDDWFGTRRTWRSAPSWLRLRNIMIILGLGFILALVAAAWHKGPKAFHGGSKVNNDDQPTINSPSKDPKPPSTNASSLSPWKKPTGFKIIGLIFFGRPPVVEILDCYLKRNLVSNGGFLDEVLWVENTKKEEDLQYLHQLVKNEPFYRSLHLDTLGYESVWEHSVDDKNLFIKIDDDIVDSLSAVSLCKC